MLSVVFPSRGRPASLLRAVASLARQPELVEVLVGLDDDDPTLNVSRELIENIPGVRVLVGPRLMCQAAYYNKLAKEAGLVGKGGGLPFFGARGQAKIKELQLGDLKAEEVSTMILDHPTVQAISNFVGPIEGILGFTFYARYKIDRKSVV